MSNTVAIINVRTESALKRQVQEIAAKLGINLSSIINAYLRQLVRTKSVSFSLDEAPTDYLLTELKESRKDVKKGFVSPSFDNTDEAIKWLENPKRKYENQI